MVFGSARKRGGAPSMGFSQDGIVSDYARERGLDLKLTVKCAGCGWRRTAEGRKALKMQAEHLEVCEARPKPMRTEPAQCPRGHDDDQYAKDVVAKRYRARCRVCEREAQSRSKARKVARDAREAAKAA